VTGNESYLIRRRINETGRLVSGPDTVVVGRFNGRLINDAIKSNRDWLQNFLSSA